MWKWLIRFLSIAYIIRNWRNLPPWARAIAAMVLVIAVGSGAIAVIAFVRKVSVWAGFGWTGVAVVFGLAALAGLYYITDIPGRMARRRRNRKASEAQTLLDSLPRDTRPDTAASLPLDDRDAVQAYLRGLLREGRLEEAEALLEATRARFGHESWWKAFRRQIELRR